MEGKFFAVIMAAGHGVRMGSDLPKQFLPLGGRAILHHTIQKFSDACPDAVIITVLPPDGDCVTWWKKYCTASNFLCPQILVRGGITRFHSVRAALERVPDNAVVAIHDGVRPLLSANMIRSMFRHFSDDAECLALVPVIPVVDTLKVLKSVSSGNGHNLVSVPGRHADRAELFAAQTPQMFRAEALKKAYGLPYDVSFTDDASVAEKYGIPLTFTDGERLNFKITDKEDLILAEAVLKQQGTLL